MVIELKKRHRLLMFVSLFIGFTLISTQVTRPTPEGWSGLNRVAHSNRRDNQGNLLKVQDLVAIYDKEDISIFVDVNESVVLKNHSNSRVSVRDSLIFDKYIDGSWYEYYLVDNDFFEEYHNIYLYDKENTLSEVQEEILLKVVARIKSEFTFESQSMGLINYERSYLPNFENGIYRLRIPIHLEDEDKIYHLVYQYHLE